MKNILEKKGLVLVITLWLIIVMSVLGVGLARISKSSYVFTKFRINKLRSRELAQTALIFCKKNRISDETSGYDTLSELETEAEYEYEGVKVVYSLIDEETRININNTSSSILKELPGMSRRKALAIISSKAKPFSVKEQILMIDEIDEEDYNDIKDLITVHGIGRININTCSEEILEILGFKQNLIDTLMEFRESEDGAFMSLGTIVSTLEEEYDLLAVDKLTLVSLIANNRLSVKSENYRIKADVYVNNKIFDRYEILFGKDEQTKKYIVKRWDEK